MSWVQPESPHVHAFSRNVPNPFLFESSAPPIAAEPAESTYILVRKAPLAPGEYEDSATPSIEVTARWGHTILATTHLTPPRPYFIGEVSSADQKCDFVVPSERIGMSRLELIMISGGSAQVRVPAQARARIAQRISGSPLQFEDAVSDQLIPLLSARVIELRFGDLTFRIEGVQAAQRTPRAIAATTESSLLSAFGGTFAICATLVAALAYAAPDLNGINDGTLDRDQLATMLQYLNAQAERNRLEEAGRDQATPQSGSPGESAAAAKGSEGAMGKLDSTAHNRRYAVAGKAQKVELSREQALQEAKTFGMINVVQGSMAPTSPWGGPFAEGTENVDAIGNMFGDDIGEAAGSNGLRTSGTGSGGGGRATDSVGMDGVGTCGVFGCGGLKGGWGSGTNPSRREHATAGPRMRIGDTQILSGSLPREVIQRVVRNNFGRFRACYETGLQKNPNLQGRVATRFVINRDGGVGSAQNGGSDLPDSAVVSCVVTAFYGLSFPAPNNGIVTVTYPIMFSPG